MNNKIFITIALLCLMAQGAWAEAVNYIYYTVSNGDKTLTKHTNGSATDPTAITSGTRQLQAGWYVVSGNVEITTKERLDCYGTVNIILKDGCKLTVPKGIRVSTDCTLNIYAQSEGDDMGAIHAEGGGEDWAAIGGHKDYVGGSLYIHGGNIYAEAKNNNAAGIGGGNGEKSGMNLIMIYGGKITAKAKNNGAGIGAGKRNNTVGTIKIYGGEITATGGKYGAGIGGAEDRGGWYTWIYGGTITATGGSNGAGIGGGDEGDGGSPIFFGGNVTANGGDNAAGIGGGNRGKGGFVTIYGGNVTAKGGKLAASIGGGYKGNGGTIIIDALGHVEAYAQNNTTLSGSNLKTAAIGAGYDGNAGSITIQGDPNVFVKHKQETGTACMFGSANKSDKGTFILGNNMRVVTTDMNSNAIEREKLCLAEQEQIRIIQCPHDNVYYELLPTYDSHRKHCTNCKYEFTEFHEYIGNDNTCVCGYSSRNILYYSIQLFRTTSASIDGYATSDYSIPDGKNFMMPECHEIPEGYTFKGWLESSERPASIEASDGESLLAPGNVVSHVWSNKTFFARYSIAYTDIWEWADDYSTAKVTIKNGSCVVAELDGDKVVIAKTSTEPTATTVGFITYTATGTYTRSDDNKDYTFTDTKTVPIFYDLKLDETDNTEAIAATNGNTVTVTLTNRMLYKDDNWNTLCLPFDLEDGDANDDHPEADGGTDGLSFSGTPLVGAKVKGLESATYEDGTLTLNFYDATSIKAGRPYLIRWGNIVGGDLQSPTFSGVTISSAINDEECAIDDDKAVTFCGTYSSISYAEANRNILYLGSGNTLYYPVPADADHPVTIGAQRAYFQLNGLTAGEKAGVRAFALNFGDESSTQGVTTPLSNRREAGDEAFYTLDGRRLSGKPSHAGVYINNGMKIVIK